MDEKQTPRLKDVAEAADVSMGTASRILRGDSARFNEETCRRVIEASRQLGWRQNLLVSSIQSGRTRTIGVLIPPYDSFWVNVLSGIHATLLEADYLPITVWIGDLDQLPHFEESDSDGLRQINRLLDQRVDGMIMWPPFSVAYYEHFRELVERRVPVTVVDHHSQVADSVETNEAHCAAAVANHLRQLGHRRVAYLSDRETPAQTWAKERRRCFTEAIAGDPEARIKSWHLNERGTDGPEIAREILKDKLAPTAVFAATDHLARLVYEAAADLDWHIPQDLSVVGFADLDFANTLLPPLTTVRQQPKEIGRRAAELTLGRLEGKLTGDDLVNVRVDGKLIVRDSTAPAATARTAIG